MVIAKQKGNPVERIKSAKPGLDILDEIHELAAQHGGWETIEPGDRERLKWIGTFFRKPTPQRFMMRPARHQRTPHRRAAGRPGRPCPVAWAAA